MKRKKKTTIVTIESRERMTIRRDTRRVVVGCEQCGPDVLMVTPNEAAARSHTETRAIFRGIEGGTVHFVESEDGGLLVCLNSVAAAATKQAF
jgi:RNase P subunit RPR2